MRARRITEYDKNYLDVKFRSNIIGNLLLFTECVQNIPKDEKLSVLRCIAYSDHLNNDVFIYFDFPLYTKSSTPIINELYKKAVKDLKQKLHPPIQKKYLNHFWKLLTKDKHISMHREFKYFKFDKNLTNKLLQYY